MDSDDRKFIFRVVIVTLSVVVMAVVSTLLYGLFDARVDNKEIFSTIGPSFNTIVGCFVGLLGGLVITKRDAP